MQRKSGSRRSYSRKRTGWGRRCKDYLRQFVAFMFSNVGIIGLVIGYTIAGSFVFIAIEGPNYVSRVEEVVKLRNETAARLWETTCCEVNMFSEENWRNRVHVELVHFQQSIVEAVQSYGYEGEQMAGNRWSFSGAFLYSLTVITTIGYGNVAPRTEWGKLATILYAIAGMPLFLLYLSNIGDILAKSFKWSYAKCCLCRGCQRRRRLDALVSQQQKGMAGDWEVVETPPPPEEPSEDSSIYDPQSVTVPVTLCLAIMVGYVYGGAVLFANWENWGLLDGAYFCFISLSTIGFGDIVPGDMIRHDEGIELRFIFCSMYLMLGMALIAMCFNLMQEEVVHKIRSCADTLRSLTPCTTSL